MSQIHVIMVSFSINLLITYCHQDKNKCPRDDLKPYSSWFHKQNHLFFSLKVADFDLKFPLRAAFCWKGVLMKFSLKVHKIQIIYLY